jgi:hypothetical protein
MLCNRYTLYVVKCVFFLLNLIKLRTFSQSCHSRLSVVSCNYIVIDYNQFQCTFRLALLTTETANSPRNYLYFIQFLTHGYASFQFSDGHDSLVIYSVLDIHVHFTIVYTSSNRQIKTRNIL